MNEKRKIGVWNEAKRAGCKRLGIPMFRIVHRPSSLSDAYLPQGPRVEAWFPVSIAQAATWDTPLVERIHTGYGQVNPCGWRADSSGLYEGTAKPEGHGKSETLSMPEITGNGIILEWMGSSVNGIYVKSACLASRLPYRMAELGVS